jgi:hypothetical protein
MRAPAGPDNGFCTGTFPSPCLLASFRSAGTEQRRAKTALLLLLLLLTGSWVEYTPDRAAYVCIF